MQGMDNYFLSSMVFTSLWSTNNLNFFICVLLLGKYWRSTLRTSVLNITLPIKLFVVGSDSSCPDR